MLSFFRRRNGHPAVAAAACMALLSACGPARPAYFQPQSSFIEHSAPRVHELTASADTLPPISSPVASLESGRSGTSEAHQTPPAAPTHTAALTDPTARHRNPDSYSRQRPNRLFGSIPVSHVAPKSQTIDRHSANRKTHRLGLVALGLSALAYAPLLLAGTGTLALVMTLTLPLAAVLLGIASLTTIRRNKERFRGKGWAMAAIVLGTGVMGMALVAIAALTVSRVVWEK